MTGAPFPAEEGGRPATQRELSDLMLGLMPSAADVEAVEEEVGMGCGAWDMVKPTEILRAAWRRYEATRTNKPCAFNVDDELAKATASVVSSEEGGRAVPKGAFNGECNRGACSNTGAVYFNRSTEAYYCAQCTRLLNQHNPEAVEMYGGPLCIGPSDPAHPHHAKPASVVGDASEGEATPRNEFAQMIDAYATAVVDAFEDDSERAARAAVNAKKHLYGSVSQLVQQRDDLAASLRSTRAALEEAKQDVKRMEWLSRNADYRFGRGGSGTVHPPEKYDYKDSIWLRVEASAQIAERSHASEAEREACPEMRLPEVASLREAIDAARAIPSQESTKV